MVTFTVAADSARAHHRRGWLPSLRWGVPWLVLLVLAQPAFAQTPAGTSIRSWAEARYQTPTGDTLWATSDTLVTVVGQVGGVDVEPNRAAVADPGDTVVFAHIVTNVGNGQDQFAVAAVSRSAWPVTLYEDTNGDGTLDGTDTPVTGDVGVAASDSVQLLVVVAVPSSALRGSTDTVTVDATSAFDGSVSDRVIDVLSLRDVGLAVTLTKSVDRTTGTVGDVLAYALAYQVTGSGSATGLTIADRVPLGAVYVPGTLRLDGISLTDAAGDDAGRFEGGSNQVAVQIGAVTGGAGGTMTFQVRMDGSASPSNTALGSFDTFAGTDTVTSNTVQTTLAFADLAVSKDVPGPRSVRLGEELEYRIAYGNESDVIAKDAVVVDTLPAGLDLVSSVPAVVVRGRELTWSLGDLGPAAAGEIRLFVRPGAGLSDTARVNNVAHIGALNASAQAAVAPEVTVIGDIGERLAVVKEAGVLEAGLGEVAPYAVTIENTGLVPLSDLRVHDRLPEGARYVPASAIGADSARTSGPGLTLFVAGPLAPGAKHTVRYAVALVSAEQELIRNVAYATADADRVRSDTAVAWLRVRRGWPMETRAVIGKVWADLDGNGVQNAGEPGVEGVDVWTDDGIVVTTDRDGKFSLANMRPGRHAFRIDRSTLPAAYGVVGEDLVIRDLAGWTTPRVNFAVAPREAHVAEVRLPVRWSLAARPVCGGLEEIVPGGRGDRTIIALFRSNGTRPAFLIDPADLARRMTSWAEARPHCVIELAGYADPDSVVGVPYLTNYFLSRARANRVRQALEAAGLGADVAVRAYGSANPITVANEAGWLASTRRVELHIRDRRGDAAPRLVQYDLAIQNPYSVAVSGMTLKLAPPADSMVVTVSDTAVRWTRADPVALAPLAPQSLLSMRGWARTAADSAAALLSHASGRWQRLEADIHNPLRPVEGVTPALARANALPPANEMLSGGVAEVVLAPPPGAAAWRGETVYRVPDGWELIPGTARLGETTAEPEMRQDRSGRPLLVWRLPAGSNQALTLGVRPADAHAPLEPVRVPPLRTSEERAAERRQAFVAGPGVEVFAPGDGSVLPSDRLYVGVRGEPGAPVALFDGPDLVAEANVRGDGAHDFIAVALSRGPHRLRVRMQNGWGQERWDSLSVHVTGPVTHYEWRAKRARLIADGHTIETVRVRVLDAWGVPVINRPMVTVAARGAVPLGDDADGSSVGLQLRADAAGWLSIPLKPAREPGHGTLRLEAGDAVADLGLEILPAVRPLMLTGVGRVGLGASPDAFGVLSVRGALDERTSVQVTVDSRHLDAGREAFGRITDPLDEAQYPILGDASAERTVTASPYAFAARVERGFDWIAFGDLPSAGFSGGLGLADYQRALSGVAARVTTGPAVWQAFGSSTSRHVRQTQIRGAGISGPYLLAPDVHPGTERVLVETRALDNAQRVLARQELVRFVDYQIEYDRGTLLLRRPVPASDTYGNPMFLVVTYESDGGGPESHLLGVRALLDAGQLLGAGEQDVLRLGATLVHDGQPHGRHALMGADAHVVVPGGLAVDVEVARSETPDSADVAVGVNASLKLAGDALQVSAGWLRIGEEFRNPANLTLQGGSEELRLGGRVAVGPSVLEVDHQRQIFGAQGVARERTSGGITQHLGSHLELHAGVADDRFETGSAADVSRAGEVKLTVRPVADLSLWAEGRRQLAYEGRVVRPDHIGVGAALRVRRNLSLDLSHRRVSLPDAEYSVTSLGARTSLPLNTEAWGSYQLAGLDGGRASAVLGVNNRLRLGDAFTLHGLFERRVGLEQASIADPVRALPFVQPEEDYWSVGLGLELVPSAGPYRLTARGEYRDGELRSSGLVTVAGDLSLNRSFAVMSRQELYRSEQPAGSASEVSREYSSLWGLAFRPIGGDRLNALLKFEWMDAENPVGGGVLVRDGNEGRVIAAAEAIWAPAPPVEFAARYAVRRTTADLSFGDGGTQPVRSWAEFVGGRTQIDLTERMAVRAEARVLFERMSSSIRWDVAPQLAVLPIPNIEVAGGYRVGDLRDPDFAVAGGHGWFLTFGARLTERTFERTADFWRGRLQ
jgi:uncharacterized repeat protein (TIGR01451 family)